MPKLINQYQDLLLEAGCDEAGRGCYAGPVFAAAVILPKDFYHPMLNDSKQVTEKQREELVPIIKEAAISWAVAHQSAKEIDASNILKAAIKCMHLSLDALKPKAKFIAVDGNRFYAYKKIPHQTIIKGDGKYANIAAASILAKTARDSWMQNYTRSTRSMVGIKIKDMGRPRTARLSPNMVYASNIEKVLRYYRHN